MRSQIFAAFLLLAAPSLAAPAPGRDSDCDATVKPTESIQKAIDNAKRGDRIVVEAGEYYEQLTITKDGIKLIGKGAKLLPPKNGYTKNFCTGLSKNLPAADTDMDAGICIYGKGFQLDDYNPLLQHRKIKIVGDYIKGVVVTGFEISGFNGENIALIGGKDTRIHKNKLVNGGQYGFLTVGSRNTEAESNIITTSSLFFIGMCMDDKSDATFKNNDISNYFIALCGQTSGGEMRKNTVRNCCIGPFIDPGIKGMKVIENTVTGRNKDCDPNFGAGIVISGASNTIVERNVINDIRNSGNGTGIFVSDDPSGAKATGNVFRRNVLGTNDVDIVNLAPATDNVFRNNDCDAAFPDPTWCTN